MKCQQLTAIIEKQGDDYVSLCPELDIASQGDTIEEARNNLKEALELFFETASRQESEPQLGQFAIAKPRLNLCYDNNYT
jgi:predicted RNase H-like HicB family nuclease